MLEKPKAELLSAVRSMSLEMTLLLVMLVTLVIPPVTNPIAPWTSIPILLFIRAIAWLLGLVLLPGLCIVRLTGIMEGMSRIAILSIAANLSLVFIGFVTLILYHASGNVVFLPWVLLAIVGLLVALSGARFKGRMNLSNAKIRLSGWNKLLVLSLLISLSMAFLVQVGQQYLIPGDLWVSLQPSVEILSTRNVFVAFKEQEYPLAFGFILSGLSACSGMPSVNAYVLLFPLVLLNMLTFYALSKIVFRMNQAVATMASTVYGLTGGLGLILQILHYQGIADFWSVSHLTYDMYFTVSFWNNIEFSHKSLALTLAYSSMIMLTIGMQFKAPLKKGSAVLLAGLMLLFSFSVHIVEPLVLCPVILVLALLSEGKFLHRLLNLGSLLVVTGSFFFLIDGLTSGYYSWLIQEKAELFFSTLDVRLVFATAFCPLFLVFAGRVTGTMSFSPRGISSQKTTAKYAKRLLVGVLLVAYLVGIHFWLNAPTSEKPLYDVNRFPWYYHVTRYGFVGFLALIGAGLTSWKAKWFAVAVTWCLAPLLIGSFWWGYRLTSYVYPVVALFAAISLCFAVEKSELLLGTYLLDQKADSVHKILKIRLRPIVGASMILLLALSSSSVIYGAAYYATSGPCLNSNDIEVLLWLQKSTPEDVTILVPDVYRLSKGVVTISDRRAYMASSLPKTIDAISVANLTQTLHTRNIQYALTTESIGKQGYLCSLLLTYSILTFQSGENRIYKLPHLTPPTSHSEVALVDKEILGASGTTSFAWLDDGFVSNWTYKNVNATTDSEVLTYQWAFHTDDALEPSMKARIPPVSTNASPYLIISYRNTPDTTTTAEDNLGQIVTLINTTGYPTGFFKNVFLPVSRHNSFTIFIAKLPENQEVAEIWIWMRNYKGLNGTVGLQVDFIGLSSVDNIPESPTSTRFLTMAVPALWTTEYTITQSLTEAHNASTIISIYDKSTRTLILESTARIFVFFNQTLAQPSWGTNWLEVHPNIITGTLDEKKILICRTGGINKDNIQTVADVIYSQIQHP